MCKYSFQYFIFLSQVTVFGQGSGATSILALLSDRFMSPSPKFENPYGQEMKTLHSSSKLFVISTLQMNMESCH